MQKMDEILDYHPEDFDVCVRPGVTREGEREHLTLIGMSSENKKKCSSLVPPRSKFYELGRVSN